MNDQFADWYRPCTTGTESGLTEDLLQKRWKGVAKLSEKSGEHALQFVRVVLKKRTAPAEFLGTFRAAFKESDATFQMSGNELEMCLLAGSVACQIMADAREEADLVALGMVCATTCVPNQPPWASPFSVCAQKHLDERLREIRAPGNLRRPQVAQKKLKPLIDTFVTRITENQPAPSSEAAKLLGEALLQALVSTAEVASEAIAELERQSKLRREETDVLWWMTTAVSRDLGVPFKELKTLAASVVAGKELAALVSPPGVLPAHSLLQAVIPAQAGKGAAGKPVGLIAAVNATERSWRQAVADSFAIDQVADLTPVLAAIKQSLTTDDAGGWTAAYMKAAGFKKDPLLQPADLGLQVHRECHLAGLVTAK